MKIEKIEVNGFKSFGDRTIFNLHDGITCIIGPNGCGKSNIVDAFRWVLGEQSAKTLRGEKMEEVIFNGSSTKKPKGLSEVTLHISGLGNGTSEENGDKDKNIVTVSRRLYRSGDSEYLINKNICRLKDIRDLFLDTGLEVKSYSIIEQGRIGEILNSKPHERRFLIEEVAGVMKYKVRKAEAQNKLESSRLNLQRIDDIISEIKKQIKTLDRLAKKAERYKKLSEELKAIELKINKTDYTQYKDDLAQTNEHFEDARQEDSALRASLSSIESDYQKQKLELVQKEKDLNGMLEEFQSLERVVADIQKQLAVLSSEMENAESHKKRLSGELDELRTKKQGQQQRVATLQGEQKDLINQLDTFNLSVSEKKDYISGIEQEIDDLEMSMEEKRREIFKITETLSSFNNDLTRFNSAIESMSKKEEGYEREIEEITSDTKKTEQEIAHIDSVIINKQNELSMLSSQKEALLAGEQKTKEHIESFRDAISSAKEELASDSSRLHSLQEITSESLSTEIFNHSERFHLIGMISDIISVDTQYEKAVEAALSDKINGFILSSDEDIQSAVAFIKENTLVRSAFMATYDSQIKIPSLPPHQSLIGPAAHFIKTDEQHGPLFKKLLGNVFIVQDIENAFELKKTYSDLTFVTLDGDVLDSSGTVFSGEGQGILQRKREIRGLENTIHEKQSLLNQKEKELASLQDSLLSSEREISSLSERLVSLEKEISLHKLELQNLQHYKEQLQRKKALIKIEIEQAQQEKDTIANNIDSIQGDINETSAKRQKLEHALSSAQDSLTEKKSHYEQYRSDLTEIKLEITSYKEKIESLSKEIESTQRSLSEIETKTSELASEIEKTDAQKREKEETSGELQGKLKEQIIQIDTVKSAISSKKEEIEGITTTLAHREKEMRSLREQIEQVHSKLSSFEVSRTESRVKMENIFNNTLQMHSVNIDHYETESPSDEEVEKVETLREKIRSIGTVNLGTIEEYEELKERYEFLSAQQQDLTKSITELDEAIKKINATTRKRLREAFVILNEKFGEVFKHLFNGGKAELVLTDEQNILESGIDINAQPPGKKLQNILLLSGGEKALTAIALIFAGFLIKPAPICILDEADAPLDDSNTDKFATMLRNLSNDIQFIVITHNRTTMEFADYLYGITMEEPGTSKVISMQFAEA